MLDMPLPKLDIRPDDPVPVTQQIIDHIRACIADGTLAPRERLPGARWLAGDLGVAYSTVTRAEAILIADGTLTSTQGKGTFVAPLPTE